MDTPDNYYAILGVPGDADPETIKRAYRQLARRFHPDLAGPEGAVQMKRINRAYDVLSDPQKRLNYDTILGGTLDLRRNGLSRARARARRLDLDEDLEFNGLSIFSTRGPLRQGPVFHTNLGVISALNSVQTAAGLLIVSGTLDGKGALWREGQPEPLLCFAADPALTVESLRELRVSPNGRLLAGWGRLGLHVWDISSGELLWSQALTQRAVSAHYSLDAIFQEESSGNGQIRLALPHYSEDPRAPRQQGVRGTDIITHSLNTSSESADELWICPEEELDRRQFWAIRLRALARDGQALLTLSCAHTPGSQDETIIVRRWDLAARARLGNKIRPRIVSSVLAGLCSEGAPPYTVTPDAQTVAFNFQAKKVRIQESNGAYSELATGMLGGSSRLAISPDATWLAVAREDSEITEGVVDLWSIPQNSILQRLYHPWQISALHYSTQGQLIVALTDGTIQIWL